MLKMDFTGKRALVTGASKGIGRGIAKKLAECGAQVVAVGRAQSDLDSLKNEVPSIETAVIDVSNWMECRKAVESLGHFHLLVNSAGVFILDSFVDSKEEDLDVMMNTNFKGLFNISQVVARSMIKSKTGGAIVHLSSLASELGVHQHAGYSSSKGAVDCLTRVMALELGPHNIRTNSVNPTVTMTDMGKMAWSDPVKFKPMLDRTPLQRFATVEDVVNAVLFLLSDNASYLNGIKMPVDGGFLAC